MNYVYASKLLFFIYFLGTYFSKSYEDLTWHWLSRTDGFRTGHLLLAAVKEWEMQILGMPGPWTKTHRTRCSADTKLRPRLTDGLPSFLCDLQSSPGETGQRFCFLRKNLVHCPSYPPFGLNSEVMGTSRIHNH